MRKITSLTDGWRFLKADIPLPQAWNAVDGQDGGNDYHRGRCWYLRLLPQEELAGERVFIEFGAAAMSAEVWYNGELLCRHDGGYSSFRVELPKTGKTENLLAVAVSNEDNDRVFDAIFSENGE